MDTKLTDTTGTGKNHAFDYSRCGYTLESEVGFLKQLELFDGNPWFIVYNKDYPRFSATSLPKEIYNTDDSAIEDAIFENDFGDGLGNYKWTHRSYGIVNGDKTMNGIINGDKTMICVAIAETVVNTSWYYNIKKWCDCADCVKEKRPMTWYEKIYGSKITMKSTLNASGLCTCCMNGEHACLKKVHTLGLQKVVIPYNFMRRLKNALGANWRWKINVFLPGVK